MVRLSPLTCKLTLHKLFKRLIHKFILHDILLRYGWFSRCNQRTQLNGVIGKSCSTIAIDLANEMGLVVASYCSF